MHPPLGKKTIRLIEYTVLTGASLYLGTLLYPYSPSGKTEVNAASLKELSPAIQQAIQKDLHVQLGNSQLTIKSSDIKSWIEPYTRNYSGKKDLRVSYASIAKYLETIAVKANTEPVNAKLKFENNRAQIFVPSIPGRKLNIETSSIFIASALIDNKNSASLSFDTIEPEITLDKINKLGINAVIGKGESDYGKSHAARIHNIKVGISKFNGIILKPGEEFSFNKLLGEVDEENGYQAELVIKNGKLVSEYGGGLCQVATTMFRAAILSGLKIIERKPHSFPVQYYNPQGFDATIYPGVVDLRFVNNTENHILIQARLIGSKLLVEVYGSDNGKKVSIEGPTQYAQKPDGSMKAYFIRKISKKDGSTEEERFDSVYKAPPPSPSERNPLE